MSRRLSVAFALWVKIEIVEEDTPAMSEATAQVLQASAHAAEVLKMDQLVAGKQSGKPATLTLQSMDVAEFSRHIVANFDSGYDELKEALGDLRGVSSPHTALSCSSHHAAASHTLTLQCQTAVFTLHCHATQLWIWIVAVSKP